MNLVIVIGEGGARLTSPCIGLPGVFDAYTGLSTAPLPLHWLPDEKIQAHYRVQGLILDSSKKLALSQIMHFCE
jgi:hypothetical protein